MLFRGCCARPAFPFPREFWGSFCDAVKLVTVTQVAVGKDRTVLHNSDRHLWESILFWEVCFVVVRITFQLDRALCATQQHDKVLVVDALNHRHNQAV